MDPGAVPGGSTICGGRGLSGNNTFRKGEDAADGGAETGSTRAVKVKSASGMVPPLSGCIIVANDNFKVAANDNSGLVAVAA